MRPGCLEVQTLNTPSSAQKGKGLRAGERVQEIGASYTSTHSPF